MPETIGDILSSGGFTETVKEAATQITTPAPPVETPAVAPEPVKTEPQITAPPIIPEAAPNPEQEFYKKFGLGSEDELKSSLTELQTFKQSVADFDSRKNYYTELEQEYEDLIKKEDQSSLFANDDEYRNFLIAQKMGAGKDFGVVQKIIRSDLNQMDDLDVLSLRDQYDIPKWAGRDDRVKKALLEELGVDVNDAEFKLENYKNVLTEEQDLKLSRQAHQAREMFNQNKSNVQIPQKVDYKQKIQDKLKQREDHFNQLNQKWGETTNRIVEVSNQIKFVDKNDKGEVIDEFAYDVDPEFKKDIPEIVNNYALQNNVEPTPENVKAVTDLLLNAYKVANWDKMLRAARNEARTQVREQLDKERFNGQPINKTEAPPDRKPDEADEINLIAGKLFK
jgi:hypothetical protein